MLKGYWHIAQMGNWKTVVKEQLELLEELKISFEVTVLGNESLVLPNNFNVRQYGDLSLFEFPTLGLLWEQSRVEDFRALYFHTKGVSRQTRETDVWRRYLDDLIIRHWGENVNYLKDFDVVGTEFRTFPAWHFSGNYWWANSKYLRTLGRPFGDRLQAEMWVLGNHPKLWCINNTSRCLYYNQPEGGWNEHFGVLLNNVLHCGSDDPKFGGYFIGGYELQQRPEEISTIIHHGFKGRSFENILEIGSAAGGLARLMRDLYGATIFLIDDNKHPKGYLRPSVLPNAVEFVGDSHSIDAKNWLNGLNVKFDLGMIDGDHSYEGVKQDFELALPFCKLLMFHDSEVCPGVKQLMGELTGDGRVKLLMSVGDLMTQPLGVAVWEVV